MYKLDIWKQDTVLFTPNESGSKSNKDQRKVKMFKEKNDKHQRKLAFASSFNQCEVNRPQEALDNKY